MLEAPVHSRPDYVLREWKVCVLRGPRADVYTVHGLDHRDGQEMDSSVIRFFDSEQQLALDVDGVVWLIPAGAQYDSDFWDRTEQIVRLISQGRDKRIVPPLTAEQERELRRLTSRKGGS